MACQPAAGVPGQACDPHGAQGRFAARVRSSANQQQGNERWHPVDRWLDALWFVVILHTWWKWVNCNDRCITLFTVSKHFVLQLNIARHTKQGGWNAPMWAHGAISTVLPAGTPCADCAQYSPPFVNVVASLSWMELSLQGCLRMRTS